MWYSVTQARTLTLTHTLTHAHLRGTSGRRTAVLFPGLHTSPCLAPFPSHWWLCPWLWPPRVGSLVHCDGEHPPATFTEPSRGTRKWPLRGRPREGPSTEGRAKGRASRPKRLPGTLAESLAELPSAPCSPEQPTALLGLTSERVRVPRVCRVCERVGCV